METFADNPIIKNDIAFFAKTNFRNEQIKFGIKQADRRAHFYVIGKTGTGKSTVLEALMHSDVLSGNGFALLDPHGDLVAKVKNLIPKSRLDDLIYFDVPDKDQPFGFNPLNSILPEQRPLAASGLLSAFKSIWVDSWGPRLEHILRNCLLALLDYPKASLADIPKLLDDEKFRGHVMSSVTNSQVRDFWQKEYRSYPPRLRSDAIAPLQNKVGAFLSNPILYKILTQPKQSIKLRSVMDQKKILLVNLSKGKIGEDTASLLGALLVHRFWLAALSRTDTAEEERIDFQLYLDEFHNFVPASLAQMLSESRKVRLNLVLANQFLTQLPLPLRDAILGNVGTIIVFRIGANDAETIAMEFAPEFKITDFTNLPNYHIYLKLMIDGKISRPFSAVTLPPDSVS